MREGLEERKATRPQMRSWAIAGVLGACVLALVVWAGRLGAVALLASTPAASGDQAGFRSHAAQRRGVRAAFRQFFLAKAKAEKQAKRDKAAASAGIDVTPQKDCKGDECHVEVYLSLPSPGVDVSALTGKNFLPGLEGLRKAAATRGRLALTVGAPGSSVAAAHFTWQRPGLAHEAYGIGGARTSDGKRSGVRKAPRLTRDQSKSIDLHYGNQAALLNERSAKSKQWWSRLDDGRQQNFAVFGDGDAVHFGYSPAENAHTRADIRSAEENYVTSAKMPGQIVRPRASATGGANVARSRAATQAAPPPRNRKWKRWWRDFDRIKGMFREKERSPSALAAAGGAGERGGKRGGQLSMLYDFDYVCKKWGCWDTGAGLKWGKDHDAIPGVPHSALPGGGHQGGNIPTYPFATAEQHQANWNQYMDSDEMQQFDAQEQAFQDYLLKSTYYDVAGSRAEGLGDWGKPLSTWDDSWNPIPGVSDPNAITVDDGVNMAYAEY